ncbi:MAG TPA: 30S ribosomal protein THX [Gammaproteobacteria bacterium]|nr:30S ribosomal protein THX [Gammaproteobacteria bacterium]
MGKGDRRTRRGKIWRGTYGTKRPRKDRKRGEKGTG